MSSTSSKNVKLNFTPGIHRESTQYAEEGAWFDVDRVRFREGRPENLIILDEINAYVEELEKTYSKV